MESVLEMIWRRREIVQGSWLFGAEVPIYLQNKIAQMADELPTSAGDTLFEEGNSEGHLFIATAGDVCMTVGGEAAPAELCQLPVFGEGSFMNGVPETYRVESKGGRPLLKLPRHKFEWILDVPIFRLRLRELHARREVFVERAHRRGLVRLAVSGLNPRLERLQGLAGSRQRDETKGEDENNPHGPIITHRPPPGHRSIGISQMTPPNRRQWYHNGHPTSNSALSCHDRPWSALDRADLAMRNPAP